jgi:hypothetical protein
MKEGFDACCFLSGGAKACFLIEGHSQPEKKRVCRWPPIKDRTDA